MIYTITFNPCLDYVLQVPLLSVGKINRSSSEKVYVGGKGINVSRVLNNLGIKSTPLGFIAGFTGKELQNRLIESGINPEFVEVKEGLTRINVKVRGEVETAINADGPNITEYNIALLLNRLDELSEDDLVVLAGNVPKCIDSNIYSLICKKLKDKGVNFIVDSTKELLINVLKYNPFLIKPNIEELEESLNVKINSIEELKSSVFKLKEMGAKNVLVSLGGDGSYLVDLNGKEYFVKAPSITVKNTVGAGDSMIAGFIYGYLIDKDYGTAIKYGVACGSATASSDDLAVKDTIDIMLDKIN